METSSEALREIGLFDGSPGAYASPGILAICAPISCAPIGTIGAIKGIAGKPVSDIPGSSLDTTYNQGDRNAT